MSDHPSVVLIPIKGKDVPFLSIPFTTTVRKGDVLIGTVQVPILVPLSDLAGTDIAAHLTHYKDDILRQMQVHSAVIQRLAQVPLPAVFQMTPDDLT